MLFYLFYFYLICLVHYVLCDMFYILPVVVLWIHGMYDNNNIDNDNDNINMISVFRYVFNIFLIISINTGRLVSFLDSGQQSCSLALYLCKSFTLKVWYFVNVLHFSVQGPNRACTLPVCVWLWVDTRDDCQSDRCPHSCRCSCFFFFYTSTLRYHQGGSDSNGCSSSEPTAASGCWHWQHTPALLIMFTRYSIRQDTYLIFLI
jgi:hypothetical protein